MTEGECAPGANGTLWLAVRSAASSGATVALTVFDLRLTGAPVT